MVQVLLPKSSPKSVTRKWLQFLDLYVNRIITLTCVPFSGNSFVCGFRLKNAPVFQHRKYKQSYVLVWRGTVMPELLHNVLLGVRRRLHQMFLA